MFLQIPLSVSTGSIFYVYLVDFKYLYFILKSCFILITDQYVLFLFSCHFIITIIQLCTINWFCLRMNFWLCGSTTSIFPPFPPLKKWVTFPVPQPWLAAVLPRLGSGLGCWDKANTSVQRSKYTSLWVGKAALILV